MSISKYLKGFLVESACKRDEEELEEKKELTAGQKELDVDGDGDIEADDLADLRAKKKKIEEEIAVLDKKSGKIELKSTDLEDETDDAPTGKADETIDEEACDCGEEDCDCADEELDEAELTAKQEKLPEVLKKAIVKSKGGKTDEEIDEEISTYDQETKSTKNRKIVHSFQS